MRTVVPQPEALGTLRGSVSLPRPESDTSNLTQPVPDLPAIRFPVRWSIRTSTVPE